MVAELPENPAENVDEPTTVNIQQIKPSLTADDDDSFLYFSYGSNLLTERIHVHITGAVFMKTAVLPDYELAFFDRSERWQGALASIERASSARVWGCVWRVPNTLAAVLDAQEYGYHRTDVNVFVSPPNSSAATDVDDDNPSFPPLSMLCRTYQYSNPDKVRNCPSPHYKNVIIAGAREHKLPSVYIEWLESNFPSNGYCGPITLKLEAIQHLNDNDGTMPMVVENDENVQQQQKQHKQKEAKEEKNADDNGDVVVLLEHDG